MTDDSPAVDQAEGLRKLNSSDPVRVIAVASGKGGVGKTNVSVNLAGSLAMAGKQVVLMDADLGLGNVDILLGINAKHDLQHVISGELTLEEVIVEGPMGIRIVPASSGVSQMAELSTNEHANLVRAFSELSEHTDVLIVDTAAGISDSVVTFSKASQEVLVVVCDEPTSITDAYALMKVLHLDHGIKRFQVLANMVTDDRQGRQLYGKVAAVADRFLEISLGYLGHVPFDEQLRDAVKRQLPVIKSYPYSEAARAFKTLADRVESLPIPPSANGHVEFFVERTVKADHHTEDSAA